MIEAIKTTLNITFVNACSSNFIITEWYNVQFVCACMVTSANLISRRITIPMEQPMEQSALS